MVGVTGTSLSCLAAKPTCADMTLCAALPASPAIPFADRLAGTQRVERHAEPFATRLQAQSSSPPRRTKNACSTTLPLRTPLAPPMVVVAVPAAVFVLSLPLALIALALELLATVEAHGGWLSPAKLRAPAGAVFARPRNERRKGAAASLARNHAPFSIAQVQAATRAVLLIPPLR